MNRAIICGNTAFIACAAKICIELGLQAEFVGSGADCRASLAKHPESLLLIGSELADVHPLNLIAALRRDAGDLCRIIAFQDGSLGSNLEKRAIAAGADGIASDSERESAMRGFLQDVLPAPTACCGNHGKDSEQDASIAGFDAKRKRALCLSFSSARGGSGKTSLAMLAALILADKGRRKVALLDFDFQFGELSFYFGCDMEPVSNELYRLCSKGSFSKEELIASMNEVADGIMLLPAPRLPEQGDCMFALAGRMMEVLRSEFDVVIADCPSHWSELQADVLDICDLNYLVMRRNAASLKASKRALDLCDRLGITRLRIVCLLNAVQGKRQLAADELRMGLEGLQCQAISDGERELEEYLSSGCAEELFKLRNPCVESLTLALEESLRRIGFCEPLSLRRNPIHEAGWLWPIFRKGKQLLWEDEQWL